MKKQYQVCLLGDSIRLIGYGLLVPDKLGKDYSVWQPEDNCRFAHYMLRMLFDYKDRLTGSDVITFNCGLWDECNLFGDGSFTDPGVYGAELARLVKQLKNMTKKLIFINTTPVSPRNIHNDNANIARFNAVAEKVMKEADVPVVDLYSAVMAALDRYICDDLIHLSEDGKELAAGLVSEAIRTAAKTL